MSRYSLAPLAAVRFTVLFLLATAPVLPAPGQPADPPAAVPAAATAAPAAAPAVAPGTIIHRIRTANERLEMTVNTSRHLWLDQKVPQAQVDNPDILEIVPMAPNQVQVSAKRTGVTRVTLWGEDKRVFTVEVLVVGDARELAALLRSEFPKTALQVKPVGSSVLITGYVDQQEQVGRIIRIAEEFYPKVINNMTVSGVQQVLLHVKVMEVSRTKLRKLGFDFAKFTNGNVLVSGVSGLLALQDGVLKNSGNETFTAIIGNTTTGFVGLLEALRQDNLMKIMSEPDLVTVSGRPAFIQVGGEYGYLVSNGTMGNTVSFKEYGTRVDFVPIVLGNGRLKLEVRGAVSEIDKSLTVGGVPALKNRVVDCGVELRAGQTLAIGGLVQQRVEAENKGLPLVSEVPYLGALFRRVEEQINEVELLILVTPELVEAMDASQVPPCGPGMQTTSPDDCELFLKGHLEVPNCCPSCQGAGCAGCGGSGLQARYNPSRPQNPAAVARAAGPNGEPAFIGPTGYDVIK